jgi:hypothetical protein
VAIKRGKSEEEGIYNFIILSMGSRRKKGAGTVYPIDNPWYQNIL